MQEKIDNRIQSRLKDNPKKVFKYEKYNMENASDWDKIAYAEYLNHVYRHNGKPKKDFRDIKKELMASKIKELRSIAHKQALIETGKYEGVYKNKPDNIYHTQAYGLQTTTRNTGNPRQHFIFTGKSGEKVLDFVNFYQPIGEDYLDASREHLKARYKPGFSRRSRKLGGVTTMDKLKNGGLRKRYPELTGEYYGRMEGRAIRSLRQARGDARYSLQTNRHQPTLSTERMYNELKPATERLFKGEAPKKKTFNQAFAEARRQGLKVFEWKGKKYGTQLASEVKNKPTSASTSAPKAPERKTTASNSTSASPKSQPKKQTVSTNISDGSRNIVPRRTSAESFPRKETNRAVSTPTTVNTPTYTTASVPQSVRRQSNELSEVQVSASRIPSMIRENQFVPGTNYLNPGQPLPPQNIEQANNVVRDRYGNVIYTDTGNALGDIFTAIGRRIAYPKRALGGLSRKEDYGSKSKPYPNVKSSDFAGGNRSYPIPTKADARDALRLAGLHGRSDVRAKVYCKYPELKKGALGLKQIGNFLKKNDEIVSAVAGGMGSLISGLANKRSINRLQAPQAPQLVAPARLRTTINVNPQLSDSRQIELNMNRNIAGNTASSVASLARQQRVSGTALANRNAIRANKENIETQLYNQDAINRQAVAAQNAQTTNAYNAARTQFENERIQALANNRTSMIDSVTGAIRDYQTGVDTRRMNRMRLASEMAKNSEQVDLFLKNIDKYQQALQGMGRLFRCGGKIKK